MEFFIGVNVHFVCGRKTMVLFLENKDLIHSV